MGGAGEGPGEYALITHLNVGPEFIHVFDGVRGRTVLDADHGFVRADRFRAKFNWAAVTESETRLHILSTNEQGAARMAHCRQRCRQAHRPRALDSLVGARSRLGKAHQRSGGVEPVVSRGALAIRYSTGCLDLIDPGTGRTLARHRSDLSVAWVRLRIGHGHSL